MRSSFAFLLLLGCGGADVQRDGGNSDSGDLPPTSATVRVAANHVPVAGADVVVHFSDGSIDRHLATASDGSIEVDIVAGQMITVAMESSGLAMTWTKVAPGDELLFDAPVAEPTPLSSVLVNIPAASIAGVDGYFTGLAGSKCGTRSGAAGDQFVEVYASCFDSEGKAVVYSMALDANDQILAMTIQRDVTLAELQSVVTLGAFDSTGVGGWTVRADNIPQTATLLFVPLYMRVDNRRILLSGELDPNPARQTRRDSNAADELEYTFAYNHRSALVENQVSIMGVEPSTTSSTVVDVASLDIPFATDISVDDIEAPRPTFSVTYESEPVDIDIALHSFFFSPSSTWYVAAPPDSSRSMRLPEMPASILRFQGQVSSYSAQLFAADFWTGFEDARGAIPRFTTGEVLGEGGAQLIASEARLF